MTTFPFAQSGADGAICHPQNYKISLQIPRGRSTGRSQNDSSANITFVNIAAFDDTNGILNPSIA
jgi:hypothetical protein